MYMHMHLCIEFAYFAQPTTSYTSDTYPIALLDARRIRMSRREATALSCYWRMEPEGTRPMQAELEVEFPIQGFRAGKEGTQDFGEQWHTEDHGIRTACRKCRIVGGMPETARVRSKALRMRFNGRGCREG